MIPAPLYIDGKQARRGIPGTDWAGLGLGRDKFRRLVAGGHIPSMIDPDTGRRYYSRLALEDHARRNGAAA